MNHFWKVYLWSLAAFVLFNVVWSVLHSSLEEAVFGWPGVFYRSYRGVGTFNGFAFFTDVLVGSIYGSLISRFWPERGEKFPASSWRRIGHLQNRHNPLDLWAYPTMPLATDDVMEIRAAKKAREEHKPVPQSPTLFPDHHLLSATEEVVEIRAARKKRELEEKSEMGGSEPESNSND